jgi:hypothetical protein
LEELEMEADEAEIVVEEEEEGEKEEADEGETDTGTADVGAGAERALAVLLEVPTVEAEFAELAFSTEKNRENKMREVTERWKREKNQTGFFVF